MCFGSSLTPGTSSSPNGCQPDTSCVFCELIGGPLSSRWFSMNQPGCGRPCDSVTEAIGQPVLDAEAAIRIEYSCRASVHRLPADKATGRVHSDSRYVGVLRALQGMCQWPKCLG